MDTQCFHTVIVGWQIQYRLQALLKGPDTLAAPAGAMQPGRNLTNLPRMPE
jgi:hypothetical protein